MRERRPVTSSQAIECDVREFLDANFPLGEGLSLGADESLLEAGVIDSLGVLEMIEFLEQRYGVRVPDAEVLPENLDSIANIIRYVAAKLEESEGGSDDGV
jgi:acyl carrier protein